MRIFDIFPIRDEMGLLKLRVKLLPEAAHIASEGSHTHQGQPKMRFLDKTKLPENVGYVWSDISGMGEGDEANWKREKTQRNALIGALEREEPEDEDLVLSCDVDEFVDPNAMTRIKSMAEKGPTRLEMRTYFYGLNWQSDMWYHPIAVYWKDLKAKGDLNEWRVESELQYVPQAGWHVTYTGSPYDRVVKLESFAHAEFNTLSNKEIVSFGHMSGVDPFGSRLQKADIEGVHPLLVEYFL
jgi:hypothetical protein